MDINSSRFRAELDNYITGGRYHKWTEELQCKQCGYRWEALLEEEYGMSSYVGDSNLCPECHTDYEDEQDPEKLAHEG